MVIHKILARKMDEEPDNPSKRCVWFLVKWKDMSYRQASWELGSDLAAVDPEGKRKINKFLQTDPPLHNSSHPDQLMDEEELDYFPPEFSEVHTILSCDTANPRHAEGLGTLARRDHDRAAKNASGGTGGGGKPGGEKALVIKGGGKKKGSSRSNCRRRRPRAPPWTRAPTTLPRTRCSTW